MRLKDYIQGDRRGKDANRLEREAMSDPFLQDALDGFDAVAGDHVPVIERLEKKFTQPAMAPRRNGNLFLYWSAAASVLLLVGFSVYFFLQRTDNTTPAIALLQPDENEQVIANDATSPQPVQMEESRQEMQAVARATHQEAPASITPPKTPELDVVSDAFVADEVVADVEVMVAEESVSDTFDYRSHFRSSAKVVAKTEQKEQEVHEKVDIEEVAVVGYGTQRKRTVTGAVSDTGKSDAIPRPFGEKEFQDYCLHNADKTICARKGVTVKLSFFIDETGKPTKIEYQRYSCEEAKKELENLLASAPVWTKKNRKVSMTVRW